MKIIDLEIGSGEWLDYRKKRIGASQSASVMGISPWQTPLELYNEKIFGKKVSINTSMKRGIEREKEALEWAILELGINLKPVVVESDLGWKFATLDGFGCDKDGMVAIEIKWANRHVHAFAKEGKVIDYYYPQVQSQMYCCNLQEMYFLSCHENRQYGPEFVMIKVKRDTEFINKMIAQELEFYNDNIVKKIPPEASERDFAKIDKDFIFDMLCDREKEFSDKIKILEEERKKIREQIIEVCKGKNSRSSSYQITKSFVKGRIDYEKACEGMDLEKFRKEGSESWRITKI